MFRECARSGNAPIKNIVETICKVVSWKKPRFDASKSVWKNVNIDDDDDEVDDDDDVIDWLVWGKNKERDVTSLKLFLRFIH